MGLVVKLVLLENTKDLCLYIHRGDLELSVYVIQKQVTSMYQKTRDFQEDQRSRADRQEVKPEAIRYMCKEARTVMCHPPEEGIRSSMRFP